MDPTPFPRSAEPKQDMFASYFLKTMFSVSSSILKGLPKSLNVVTKALYVSPSFYELESSMWSLRKAGTRMHEVMHEVALPHPAGAC